jgi:hypothetical protein
MIYWLSLGENCLSDDILKRTNLKSFSTPYSSAFSNIDYAIQLEKTNYLHLLEPSYLEHGFYDNNKVVRSKLTLASDDIHDPSCSQSFMFPHHNPIDSIDDRKAMLRRIDRLQNIKGEHNIVFLYYHRYSKKSDILKLRKKLNEFQSFYTSSKAVCYIVLFYQSLFFSKSKERGFKTISVNNNIFEFAFCTEHLWGGNYWRASDDDDLIIQMIDLIKPQMVS